MLFPYILSLPHVVITIPLCISVYVVTGARSLTQSLSCAKLVTKERWLEIEKESVQPISTIGQRTTSPTRLTPVCVLNPIKEGSQ